MSNRTQEEGRSYYTERDFNYTPSPNTVGDNIRENIEWQCKLLWATRKYDPVFDRGPWDDMPVPAAPILKLTPRKPVWNGKDNPDNVQCVKYGGDTEWEVYGEIINFDSNVSYAPCALTFYGRTEYAQVGPDGTFVYTCPKNNTDRITCNLDVTGRVDALVVDNPSSRQFKSLVIGIPTDVQVKFIIIANRPHVDVTFTKPAYKVGDANDPIKGEITCTSDAPTVIHEMSIRLNDYSVDLVSPGENVPKPPNSTDVPGVDTRTTTAVIPFTVPNSAIKSGINFFYSETSVWMPQYGGEATMSYSSTSNSLRGLEESIPVSEFEWTINPEPASINDTLKFSGWVKVPSGNTLQGALFQVDDKNPVPGYIKPTSEPSKMEIGYEMPAENVGTGIKKFTLIMHTTNGQGTLATVADVKTKTIYGVVGNPAVSIETTVNPIFLNGEDCRVYGYASLPDSAVGFKDFKVTIDDTSVDIPVTPTLISGKDYKWECVIPEDDFIHNSNTEVVVSTKAVGELGEESETVDATLIIQSWDHYQPPYLTIEYDQPFYDMGSPKGRLFGTVEFSPSLAHIVNGVVTITNQDTNQTVSVPVFESMENRTKTVSWTVDVKNLPEGFLDAETGYTESYLNIIARAKVGFDGGESNFGNASLWVSSRRPEIPSSDVIFYGATHLEPGHTDTFTINGTSQVLPIPTLDKITSQLTAKGYNLSNINRSELWINHYLIETITPDAGVVMNSGGVFALSFSKLGDSPTMIQFPKQEIQIWTYLKDVNGVEKGFVKTSPTFDVAAKPPNYVSVTSKIILGTDTLVRGSGSISTISFSGNLPLPYNIPNVIADTMADIYMDIVRVYLIDQTGKRVANFGNARITIPGLQMGEFTVRESLIPSTVKDGDYFFELEMVTKRTPAGSQQTFATNTTTRKLENFTFKIRSRATNPITKIEPPKTVINVFEDEYLTFKAYFDKTKGVPTVARANITYSNRSNTYPATATLDPSGDFYNVAIKVSTNTEMKGFDITLNMVCSVDSYETDPTPPITASIKFDPSYVPGVSYTLGYFPEVVYADEKVIKILLNIDKLHPTSPFVTYQIRLEDDKQYIKTTTIKYEDFINKTEVGGQYVFEVELDKITSGAKNSVSVYGYAQEVFRSWTSSIQGGIITKLTGEATEDERAFVDKSEPDMIRFNLTYNEVTGVFDYYKATGLLTSTNPHTSVSPTASYGFYGPAYESQSITLESDVNGAKDRSVAVCKDWYALHTGELTSVLTTRFTTVPVHYSKIHQTMKAFDASGAQIGAGVSRKEFTVWVVCDAPYFTGTIKPDWVSNIIDGVEYVVTYRFNSTDKQRANATFEARKAPNIDNGDVTNRVWMRIIDGDINVPLPKITETLRPDQKTDLYTADLDLRFDIPTGPFQLKTLGSSARRNAISGTFNSVGTPLNAVGVARPLAPSITSNDEACIITLNQGVGTGEFHIVFKPYDGRAPNATIKTATAYISGPTGEHISTVELVKDDTTPNGMVLKLSEKDIDIRGGNTFMIKAVSENYGFTGPDLSTHNFNIIIKNT